MRHSPGWFALACVGLAFSATTAPAQFSSFTINYSSTGVSSAGAALNPTSGVPTGLTASTVGRKTGLTAVAGVNSFDTSGFATTNTVDPAVTGYLSITLNPGTGVLNLDTVGFRLNRDTAGGNTDGPKKAELRSSLDNFASVLDTISLTPNPTGTLLTSGNLPAGFDALITPIEFRVYGANATATTGILNLFNGTTSGANAVTITGGYQPVPEPATVGLMAVAGLALSRCRRCVRRPVTA